MEEAREGRNRWEPHRFRNLLLANQCVREGRGGRESGRWRMDYALPLRVECIYGGIGYRAANELRA